MDGIKVWDNGKVHVVKGAEGVVISLPNEAAKRLSVLLWRHEDEECTSPEGKEDLDALMEALFLLIYPDVNARARSIRYMLSKRYLTTLAETVHRT